MSFSDENGKIIDAPVPGDWPVEILVTVDFKDLGDKTQITITEVGIPIIMSIFASAGLIGLFKLLFEVIVHKKHLSLRSIGGGLLLGSTNYFSLYFLLKCLESPGTESSTVFALVNIGVVITSFITGLVLFKEPSDRNKIIGLMLSVIAILVLSVQLN